MRKGYSLHWYLQGLKAGSDCLRELTFDTLRNINTVKLLVSATGTVDLPCDFVDWVKIGVSIDQYVKPLTQKDGINRLQNLDNSGQPIDYPNDSLIVPTNDLFSNFYSGFWWGNGFTTDGQYLGGWYGFNAGNNQDGFKVIRERSQIQLDENSGADFVILEYISDGQSSDSATQIHPYAQATIEAYVHWQFKEHNRSIGEGEKQRAQLLFSNAHARLRSRLNGLTKSDIQRIVRKAYGSAIKG